MVEYRNIYLWNVIDELKRGEDVYILDREKLEIYKATELRVWKLIMIVEHAENDNRYAAWVVEKAKETEEVDE